jgi:hydrogenase maturation protease
VLVEVKRLVLGIGNTIMGDDGVGIYVARMVKDRVQSRADLQVRELGASGFKLVEEMLGYDEVVIVDSYAAGDNDTGQIREFGPEDFEDTLHASSPHGANFATALELYRNFQPDRIPKNIRIFTVGICPTDSFGETLSDRVQEAALKLTEIIVTRIEQGNQSDPEPIRP